VRQPFSSKISNGSLISQFFSGAVCMFFCIAASQAAEQIKASVSFYSCLKIAFCAFALTTEKSFFSIVASWGEV
jgi:hypothetical protein